MIREIIHFVRYAPAARKQQKKMDRPAFYDLVESQLDKAGKAAWRDALVADLSGDVLEIGAGTGLMFVHYPKGVRLTATEPDDGFLCCARDRVQSAPVPGDTDARRD